MVHFQQDNNNNEHTAKTWKEWLKDNSVKVLERPSQSPDWNLNISENGCKEERAKLHQAGGIIVSKVVHQQRIDQRLYLFFHAVVMECCVGNFEEKKLFKPFWKNIVTTKCGRSEVL